MEKLQIDDDMLVVAADNLLFFSFQEFVDFAREKGTSCIMCHEQPSIEKLQRTGVVELDSDYRVLGMEEKPQVPKSHWAVPPFYIYLRKDLSRMAVGRMRLGISPILWSSIPFSMLGE